MGIIVKILLTVLILIVSFALGFILDSSGVDQWMVITVGVATVGILKVWGILKAKDKENNKNN